jgi:small-conductance mechanosensitive channel
LQPLSSHDALAAGQFLKKAVNALLFIFVLGVLLLALGVDLAALLVAMTKLARRR